MKTLILVRHAEASEGMSDKNRSLTSGGMIDAARMGKHLAPKLAGVQSLIASPAERTVMTSQVLAEQIGFDFDKLQTIDELYEGSPRHYLAVVNGLSESMTTVMIVGHNPTITYLAEYLSHEELGNIPTCGIVGITFEGITWGQVSGRLGKLAFYDSPDKMIGMSF
jgi:phosphohistidine phosphatase